MSVFQVVTTGKITRDDRAHVWNKLHRAVKEKKTRPIYRAVNKHGFMYAGEPWSSKFFYYEIAISTLL